MKLISLKLENFRQHEDSFIEFSDGITVINGTNGAGKSTILEAISWAIYGTDATRGNKDSIKFNKAKAKAKVRVELALGLDSEIFRIERFLDKADIYLADNSNPIVTSQQEVTKYLIEKLGMTKDEFFNTYFTGQKELNFLANQKPVDRRKFISKVLNYEKIREVQEQARADRNSINNEISGLRQGISDFESLKEEKKLALIEIAEITNKLNQTQKEFSEKAGVFAKIEPEWENARKNKENFEKKQIEFKFLSEKIKDLNKNIETLEEKNKILEEKSKIFFEISICETEYRETESKIKELEKLQEKETLKQSYIIKIEGLEKEIQEKLLAQEEVIKSGKEKRLIVDKIPAVKEEIDKLSKEIQEIETKIASSKKEKEVLIRQKQQEIEKINKQLLLISEKGKDGACPTCERPLKNEFEKVTGNFKDQINCLENEIKSFKLESEKLIIKPAEIAKLQRNKEEKEKDLTKFNEIQGEYKNEQDRYLKLKTEIDAKNLEKTKSQEELLKFPHGFNIEDLKNLREKIIPLREKFEQILALKVELSSFEKIKNELSNSIKTKQETADHNQLVEKELKTINYSEESYLKAEKIFSEAKEEFYALKEQMIKIEAEERNIKEKITRIEKIEDSNKEKLKLLKEKQERVDLLSELDRFYGQFWEKLNNQARPEISELAGKFLVDLTDGRYCELEINEKYEICLHDDGEIKPVISGGEEDIVNLCVRLAISQIIAQRSGKTLSLLILDEIFGSLDENRRNNVVNLLRSLTNSFEQVILITHIEDIKNEIDNIITIEYDAEKGCSKIFPAQQSFQEGERFSKKLFIPS